MELSHIANANVFFKMECWQHTGSFKARGAFNCLQILNSEQRDLGVVAPTAGNHGIGIAYAASTLGIPAHIFLPDTTDQLKIKYLKKLDANISKFPDIETARIEALKSAKTKGFEFISAYNNKGMICGGGTVAIELLQDICDVDIVVVCVGGGGLISGISSFLKANNPSIQVWGVQTENSPTFIRWFENKEITPVKLLPSIAPGLSGAIEPETMTFSIVRDNVDRMIGVSDNDLIEGLKFMVQHHQQIVEPSGIAGVSAILRESSMLTGKKIAVVVTGRNISYSEFNDLVN
ncbi:threonine dehydratase [Desulforhopalus singaporensis]|uniref:Threonine dehydratase n=2 Tax=Desulforhopalus singaporensis TaxID=91360 RepID=A0A1H0W2G5_9BACT|nr:threonine dehydratase [Desulforhopalus singaporensis]